MQTRRELIGGLLAGAAAATTPVWRTSLSAAGATQVATGTPLRVGMIGLDTSHVTAFTSILNDPANPDHIPGARVVAAFKGGSPDVEASATRVDKFTADLRDKWKVEIVGSIEALLPKVDVVMVESVDARPHLAQARPVIAARKPLFIDKPMAASTKDAAEIVRLAKAGNVPVFSASSRRYVEDVLMLQDTARVGAVLGASTWGPATLEPHHPDLFWYGVHAVETLYQLMGPGCVSVSRTSTATADVVTGTWADGRVGTVRGVRGGKYGTYGHTVFGEKDVVTGTSEMPLPDGTKRRAGYYGLLVRVMEFFRTGKPPVSPEETVETLAFMEAADISKARGGAVVKLSEVPR
ncbi:oxidoreductase [Luteitalea sp. TBR-22]|uniref:Gfo/Idh/MocA family protein n=1 Tax=Luteitalea sp. TBR-22 TaxID=2802971 RepID=UPI001EF69D69|nr:Gfo/Idh/MocA family oxidoreductase [Luteitalea sp. TBR-22]BCS34086.2 oxidoreductase [Luteitalea sp. TBR-22]